MGKLSFWEFVAAVLICGVLAWGFYSAYEALQVGMTFSQVEAKYSETCMKESNDPVQIAIISQDGDGAWLANNRARVTVNHVEMTRDILDGSMTCNIYVVKPPPLGSSTRKEYYDYSPPRPSNRLAFRYFRV